MFFYRNFRKLFWIVALVLSSCSYLHKPPKSDLHYLTWSQRREQLSELESWNMRGAVGIKLMQNNVMAHFFWQQSNDDYDITVYTPLNLSSVKIIGNPKKVMLWRSSSDQVTAKTPEILMYQQLGWYLPLSNMRYWILGMPAPNVPYHAKFDAYHHVIFLQQEGWKINYDNFVTTQDVDLPYKIIMTNADIEIKLVIKGASIN